MGWIVVEQVGGVRHLYPEGEVVAISHCDEKTADDRVTILMTEPRLQRPGFGFGVTIGCTWIAYVPDLQKAFGLLRGGLCATNECYLQIDNRGRT